MAIYLGGAKTNMYIGDNKALHIYTHGDKPAQDGQSELYRMQFSGTIEQDGEVWHIIEPQASSMYEIALFLDTLNAEVNIYDSEMMPVIPEYDGLILDKGKTYNVRVEFADITSPQEYLCIITPKVRWIPEHWNYYGDLFDESPGNWIAVIPEADGIYNFCVDAENNAVSAVVWEWDNGLTQIPINADGNFMMRYGVLYYIEVNAKNRNFGYLPYTLTIQLIDDRNEDEDEEYPDDEDYDYEASDDPEFEFDIEGEDDTADDSIQEGGDDEDGIAPASFELDMETDQFNGIFPTDDIFVKPYPSTDTFGIEEDHSECEVCDETGNIGIQPFADTSVAIDGRKIHFYANDGSGRQWPTGTNVHACKSRHQVTFNEFSSQMTGYKQAGWMNADASIVHWFKNSNGTDNKDSIDFTCAENWYAFWAETSIKITYDGNKATSGNPPSVQTVACSDGTIYSGKNTLERGNLEFKCWNTKADGTGYDYNPGGYIVLTQSRTLYAKWQGKVEYASDGSDGGNPPPSQTFIAGNKTTLAYPPGSLYKNGCEFGGWIRCVAPTYFVKYTIKSGETKQILFSQSVKLRPYWAPKRAVVTYVSTEPDATGNPPKDQPFTVDRLFSLRGPGTLKRTGYRFAGWSLNENGSEPITKRVQFSGNETLFAAWREDWKTLTYSSNGATKETKNLVPEPQDFLSGYSMIIDGGPGDLEKFGWYADDWKKGRTTYSTGEEAIFKSNVTLYPNWERNTYPIRYDINDADASGTVPPSHTYEYSKSFRVPKQGDLWLDEYREFTGWNTSADGKGRHFGPGRIAALRKEEKVLFAEWTPTRYIINYDKNGATGAGPSSHTVKYPFTDVIKGRNRLVNGNKTFLGWKDNSTGKVYQPGEQAIVSARTTLYAQWGEGKNEVVYLSNGAPVSIPSKDYTPNEKIDLPNANMLYWEHHTLTGWKDEKGTPYDGGASVTFMGGTVYLYAQWGTNMYNLKYDGNGYTGDQIPQERPASALASISVRNGTRMERPGYVFAGWKTEREGPGERYYGGGGIGLEYPSNITLRQDTTTLYAIWERPVSSVVLSDQRIVLYPEEKYGLTAKVLPEDATDKDLLWRVGISSIASVDNKPAGSNTAIVTAKKVGNASLSVVSNTRHSILTARDYCVVEVIPSGSVKYLRLSHDVLWLKPGEQRQVIATVLPSTATDKTVTWISNDIRVATANSNGNITGNLKGFTEVRCTTNNRKLKKYVVVIVADEQDYEKTLQKYYDSIDPWRVWDRFFDENMGWLNGIIGIGGSFFSIGKGIEGDVSGMFVVDKYGNVGILVSVSVGAQLGNAPTTGSIMYDEKTEDITKLGFLITDIDNITREKLAEAVGFTVGGSITVKHFSFGGDFSYDINRKPTSFTLIIGGNEISLGLEGHANANFTAVIPLYLREQN